MQRKALKLTHSLENLLNLIYITASQHYSYIKTNCNSTIITH